MSVRKLSGGGYSGWGAGTACRAGRKFHNKYEELQFVSTKLDNGRCAAICEICNVTLKNTSVSRLETHRKRCRPVSDSEMANNYSNDTTEQLSESCYDIELGEFLHTSVQEEVTEEILLDVDVSNKNVDIDMGNLEIIIEDAPQSINVKKENDHSSHCLSDNTDKGKKMSDTLKMKNSCNIDPLLLLRPCSAQSSHSSVSSLSRVSETSLPDFMRNDENRRKVRPNKKRKSNSDKVLNSFIDTMSLDAKDKADMALASFFYGCNIPFSVVDSDHFKNFIKTIHPSYNPPCRKTLSSTLLDKVTTEEINLNSKYIGKQSCLIIYGWKNSSNNTKNVVTMLQTAGGHSLFLEHRDFSTERETGEALANICQQLIEIASSQYKSNIYAVVSDNASNMVKIGRLTTLWHSTCSSHIANLLTKDILDLDVMKQVTIILKEFKRTDLENLLKENGGWKIVLPGETRCSNRDACQNFIKNLSVMKEISALKNVKIKANVAFHLYDEDFLEKVHETINALNLICELVNKCQSSDFSIADSTEEWIDLKNKMIGNANIKLAVEHRFDMAVKVYGMAANFFHPLYKGKKLENEHEDLVQNFLIDHLDSNGLEGLHAFTSNAGIFSKLSKKKNLSPDTFWGLVERKFPTLSALALKLIKIPASSAQLELIFSNSSFIHSSIRNRLGPEKSNKLISVYYSLKMRDKNKSDDY